MSPRKHSTTMRSKKGEVKSKSKEGIFIVERRRHPRFSLEPLWIMPSRAWIGLEGLQPMRARAGFSPASLRRLS